MSYSKQSIRDWLREVASKAMRLKDENADDYELADMLEQIEHNADEAGDIIDARAN